MSKEYKDPFGHFVYGKPPARVVAEELGLTVNAVLIAKSRVLARLRQAAAGLVD
jgi:RNA polymerase sigma-70 factor (ECF subfamily)